MTKTKLNIVWRNWISPCSESFYSIVKFRDLIQSQVDLCEDDPYEVIISYKSNCYRIELDEDNRIDLYEKEICIYHTDKYNSMLNILKPLAKSGIIKLKK